MKRPRITTIPAIDNQATGQKAKAYREAKRVTLAELAQGLKTPRGVPMTEANLWLYEGGERAWTKELFAQYIEAVDFVARTMA